MQTIAIVKKNADFTEGTGPMLFHKAFTTFEIAHKYIMAQPGIYGSSQYNNPNRTGTNYWYNGYSIDIVPLEDSIISKEDMKELEKELKEITQRQEQIKKLLQ